MDKRFIVWLGVIGAILVASISAALLLPRSFALTAFSDMAQLILLLSGTAAFVPLALRSGGRTRVFWCLVTVGVGLWCAYQLFWTYSEVVLRSEVPDPSAWDVVLFLHFVPLMAAIALRPHVPRDEYAARVGHLDFVLLLVWWLYLYVFIVMPWQYVTLDVAAYDRNLNNIYNTEKLVFLGGLAACWATSKGQWRRFYVALFAMSICYSAASTVANWAIARKAYYSGSLYDIPLVASMASLSWIGLRTQVEEPEQNATQASTGYGVWIARCSMIAVFSLPLFAAWALADAQLPVHIRMFRVSITFCAAFVLGVMMFFRQGLLDRQLMHLISHSREAFENLKRLQAQILQSEKLMSVGQLVGGAAHELNNPITAMLGYSDLLLNTALTPEQQSIGTKLGQHIRRTRSLVASLISFARQTPAPKSRVDLNTLARTAVKLTQPQCEALGVSVRTDLDSAIPRIHGDSNQLLQVCLQLITNCLHIMSEKGGNILDVSTSSDAGACALHIAATVPVFRDSESTATEDNLSLSACQGILQEHRGQISFERRPDMFVLRVELPASPAPPEASRETTESMMLQSQPYA